MAIKKKDKIGMCLVIMMLTARPLVLYWENISMSLGLTYEIYIPDRKTEGYGPSIKGFKKLIDKWRLNIIFTVDCGTLSFEAIEYARNKNIDVIVLDHHQSEIKSAKSILYCKSQIG